jgi:hypothetical protein
VQIYLYIQEKQACLLCQQNLIISVYINTNNQALKKQTVFTRSDTLFGRFGFNKKFMILPQQYGTVLPIRSVVVYQFDKFELNRRLE